MITRQIAHFFIMALAESFITKHMVSLIFNLHNLTIYSEAKTFNN